MRRAEDAWERSQIRKGAALVGSCGVGVVATAVLAAHVVLDALAVLWA